MAKPHLVIHLAANCGGIGYNQPRPADLLSDNLRINQNVVDACVEFRVEKLVTIGSVCAYPEKPPHVPFIEEDLWAGYPEPTNAPYGISKRVLLSLCQTYRQQYGLNAIHLILANLYGPGDCFDPERSHCIPAIIRKIYLAKRDGLGEIKLWGTGSATRDFLHARDAARGIVLAAECYDGAEAVNMGTGFEVPVSKLAMLIAFMMDWSGEILWDSARPDGQPRRVLDSSRAAGFGFSPEISLPDGLRETIDWYLQQQEATCSVT